MRRLVKSSRVVAVLAAVAAGLTCTTGDSALAAISTTTPADSFEYEIRSCDGSVTGEGRSSIGWERWMGASGETHVEACPDEGIGFDLTSDLKLGDSFGWVFWPYGQLKVSSTTMLVTKGDSDTGIIYSVSTCAGCASQGTIDVPGTGQPGAPQRFDFTPATGFVVTGICMRPVCARTDGLRFKDVKMTMYDNDPPLLELLSPMIWLSQNGDVLARSRFGDWNRPDQFGVDAIAADRGVGFGGGELLVDGIRVAAMSGACWLIPQRIPGRTSPCPTYSTRFADSLENAGIPDGWHLLAFKLEDALGNSNVVGQTEFGIDGRPPAEPTGFSVSGATPSGWHASTMVAVDWDAPPPDAGSGIVSTHFDVDPVGPGQVDPAEQFRPTTLHHLAGLGLPSDGKWRVDFWYEDAVGNLSPRHHEFINVDGSLPAPPVLQTNPTINRAQLTAPYLQGVTSPVPDPALESGVCGYVLSADRDPLTRLLEGEPRPLTSGGLPVPANLPSGANYVHVSAVSCSGRRSVAATTPLVVDDTSPVMAIESSSGEGWSRSPVNIRISAADDLSIVRRVFYWVDDHPTVSVAGSVATVTLGDGAHEFKYGAEDAAGNTAVTLSRSVKVDGSPPEAWLEATDASNPSVMEGFASDLISGVSVAWMQYRRVDGPTDSGDGAWRTFGQPARPQHSGGAAARLSARLPEEQLADGVYAVRIVALDVAGNEVKTSRTLLDGEMMLVTLPTRARPVLTAGVSRVVSKCFTASGRICSKRSRCGRTAGHCLHRFVAERYGARSTREMAYGAPAAVVGELRSKSGDPIAGARLKIYAARKGSRMEADGEVTTGRDGEYEYRIPTGTSRSFVVRYVEPGGAGYVDATAVTLAVRAGVSIQPQRRRVRPGGAITIEGHLRSDAVDIPDGGKLVTVEQYDHRGRVVSVRNVYSRVDGGFVVGFAVPSSVRAPSRLKFRATVPSDVGWPFAAGTSRLCEVVVRG